MPKRPFCLAKKGTKFTTLLLMNDAFLHAKFYNEFTALCGFKPGPGTVMPSFWISRMEGHSVSKETELKLLIKALTFAANKHRNQRRKNVDAFPYINHPISLVNILCNEAHITDINLICGALLHDTVEDTETTAEELIGEFGQEISNIVMEVTDDKSIAARQKRKQLQIEHAPHMSESAKLLKLADKISNLRDMSIDPPATWSLQRQREYFDWAKQVIDQLRGTHSELEKLFDQAYTRRM
jgi:guanosine-3',5'-bis(diphosphate) 3'-pyrophosphohydrolase